MNPRNGPDRLTFTAAKGRPAITADQKARLRRANYAATVAQLSTIACLYLACAAAACTGPPAVAAACVTVEAFIAACAVSCIHECTHSHLLRPRALNGMVGRIIATAAILNFSLYRSFHLAHHACTAGEDDTEGWREPIHSPGAYARAMLFPTFHFYVWKASAACLFGSPPAYVRRVAERRAVTIDAYILCVWLMTVSAVASRYPYLVAMVYVLPIALSVPLTSFLALPEHYATDRCRDVKRNTRSVQSGRLFRFFYLNNNYHAEHHAYPWVRAQQLPLLHEMISDQIKHRSNSYVGFHIGILRTLQWWRGAGHGSES